MPRVGFINHAKLAFNRSAGCKNEGQEAFRTSIEKNRLEKIGNVMTWHITDGVRKVFRAAKDPRVLTVALTALAMVAASFIFYPATTYLAVKATFVFLGKYAPWAVMKFSIYAATLLGILGTGVRTLGRFANKTLMNHFYASHSYRLNNHNNLESLPRDQRAAEVDPVSIPLSLPKNGEIESKPLYDQ